MPDDGPRPIPREEDAPRWLILLMIAGMVLLVAGAFQWAQSREIASHVIGRPATGGAERSITSIEQIVAEEIQHNLLGRDVSLWAVPVLHVPGDYVFWVGTDSTRRVAVVLLGERARRQPETEEEVRVGDTVAIFGTIREVREVRRLDEVWAMSADEWSDLGREEVYISALRVDRLAR